MRIWILTGLLLPTLAIAETAAETPCPTLISAAFTSEVEEREPVSNLESAPLSINELLFFTAIQDGNGAQLHHSLLLWQIEVLGDLRHARGDLV